MSATFKFYFLLIWLSIIVCFLGYGLYQGYAVLQNTQNNREQIGIAKREAESIFVAMPIQLPQSEVIIPQAREIELPKVKEAIPPKQTIQKQNIVVIKGATSALIPSSIGGIK